MASTEGDIVLDGFRFSHSQERRLHLAALGHLSSAEVQALVAELPDGWDLDTALKKFQNPRSEQGLQNTNEEVILQLRMVSEGFLEETDLAAVEHKLPAGWTAEQALDAYENKGKEFANLCSELGLLLEAPEKAHEDESGESQSEPGTSHAAATAARAVPADTASPDSSEWRPDESMRAMLRMANAGYMDDMEISNLEQGLPQGWDVDTAVAHLDKCDARASVPVEPKAKARDAKEPQHSPAQELLMHLRMVVNGYMDECELAPFEAALPTGWTLTQAIHLFENGKSKDQAKFVAALEAGPAASAESSASAAVNGASSDTCSPPRPALAGRSVLDQTRKDGPSFRTAAKGNSVSPGSAGSASPEQQGTPAPLQKRSSLRRLMDFLGPKKAQSDTV